MKPKLYFAAPLFSEAELSYNAAVAQRVEQFFEVYLPQRDGGLFVNLVGQGLTAEAASARIFSQDIAAINSCDVLLMVLDGRSIDEGAAFELGYAHALGKVCVGLQTDPRRLLPSGNNPMIAGPLVRIFPTPDALGNWAASFTQVLADKTGHRYVNDRGSKL